MGGAVAARFVAEGVPHAAVPGVSLEGFAAPPPGLASAAPWYRPVDGLVLSSPALDPGMTGFQKVLAGVLGALAPNLAVSNGLRPEWVSRDPQVVAAYVADPLVHDRVTPRLVNFVVDSGLLVRERAANWRVDTLLMFAGSDRCVAPSGSRAFAAAAPTTRLSVREFGPLFHEIFNEPEQADVFATFGLWLQGVKQPR
jgi:alpha-beta hydrolase superfamily lysophospholipase